METTTPTWQLTKSQIKELPKYLLVFLKNPMQMIKSPPTDWTWFTILFLQITLAISSGVLAGFISGRFTRIVAGFIINPFASFITLTVIAGFFYYLFIFFFRREIEFRKLYTLVVLANTPLLILHCLSPIIRPINLVGFAITSVLLITGFVHHYQMPKKQMIKIIGGLYLTFLLLWVFNMMNFSNTSVNRKYKISPKSIEKLEKELEQ